MDFVILMLNNFKGRSFVNIILNTFCFPFVTNLIETTQFII